MVSDWRCNLSSRRLIVSHVQLVTDNSNPWADHIPTVVATFQLALIPWDRLKQYTHAIVQVSTGLVGGADMGRGVEPSGTRASPPCSLYPPLALDFESLSTEYANFTLDILRQRWLSPLTPSEGIFTPSADPPAHVELFSVKITPAKGEIPTWRDMVTHLATSHFFGHRSGFLCTYLWPVCPFVSWSVFAERISVNQGEPGRATLFHFAHCRIFKIWSIRSRALGKQ